MKKIIQIIILISLGISLVAKENLVDHLSIASLLIYDGKYEKAQDELLLVDKQDSNFDAAKYYTIKGVLYSKKQEYKKAVQNYKKAIEATKAKVFKAPKNLSREEYLFSIASDEPKKQVPKFDAKKVKKEKVEKLYMYLSQSYFKIKEYEKTAKSLDLAGEMGRERASLFTLRAECYWKVKQYSNAINALERGSKLFPNDTTLQKQKFYYFAGLGLYQAAIQNAMLYMKKTDASADEYITLAQLFVEAKQIDMAIKILEVAKAKFPNSAKTKILLGHVYLKKDMQHTTAYMFKRAAYTDKIYFKDAVEMHRRIKDYPHAIYLNSQISDNVEKLKQKLAILIDRAEFAKVIGLKDALTRYNMLKDDNIRYALAYSYYMAKDYDKAEKNLKKIRDANLFKKATVIRTNIEKCRNDAMECI
jgi:tetratricopeptide (TPR) repeat protein